MPGAPKTVLLVWRYTELRRQLDHFVQSTGAQVLCAGSGAEGLAIASSHPGRIDLLLAEFRPADMSSPELLARIRQTRPALPALVLSPESEDVMAQLFNEPGVAFIETPFAWSVLGSRLTESLG